MKTVVDALQDGRFTDQMQQSASFKLRWQEGLPFASRFIDSIDPAFSGQCWIDGNKSNMRLWTNRQDLARTPVRAAPQYGFVAGTPNNTAELVTSDSAVQFLHQQADAWQARRVSQPVDVKLIKEYINSCESGAPRSFVSFLVDKGFPVYCSPVMPQHLQAISSWKNAHFSHCDFSKSSGFGGDVVCHQFQP
jgi:hypothetical protein